MIHILQNFLFIVLVHNILWRLVDLRTLNGKEFRLPATVKVWGNCSQLQNWNILVFGSFQLSNLEWKMWKVLMFRKLKLALCFNLRLHGKWEKKGKIDHFSKVTNVMVKKLLNIYISYILWLSSITKLCHDVTKAMNI